MTDSDPGRSASDKWAAQLRKGSLELAVLAMLWGEPRYGLEILNTLNDLDLPLGEGTLYPILNRLRGDGLLASEWRQEGTGNPRKYYALTPEGRVRVRAMVQEWTQFSATMERVCGEVLAFGRRA